MGNQLICKRYVSSIKLTLNFYMPPFISSTHLCIMYICSEIHRRKLRSKRRPTGFVHHQTSNSHVGIRTVGVDKACNFTTSNLCISILTWNMNGQVHACNFFNIYFIMETWSDPIERFLLGFCYRITAIYIHTSDSSMLGVRRCVKNLTSQNANMNHMIDMSPTKIRRKKKDTLYYTRPFTVHVCLWIFGVLGFLWRFSWDGWWKPRLRSSCCWIARGSRKQSRNHAFNSFGWNSHVRY